MKELPEIKCIVLKILIEVIQTNYAKDRTVSVDPLMFLKGLRLNQEKNDSVARLEYMMGKKIIKHKESDEFKQSVIYWISRRAKSKSQLIDLLRELRTIDSETSLAKTRFFLDRKTTMPDEHRPS